MKNETVNDRIKRVRLECGLSQAKFCKAIFLTPGHYAGIELNQREVNQRTIKLVAITYNVSEDYLKTGREPVFTQDPDPKLQRMISVFQELPDECKDYILQQIELLKKLHKRIKEG
jgi:transcriptional regulator with XRE-family HTH domain